MSNPVTREQFISIVGKQRRRGIYGLVEGTLFFDIDGSVILQPAITPDIGGAVNFGKPNPFRLRCLLYGLGIKCDWDAEVSFERLMAIEGAWSNDSKQVVAFEAAGKLNECWFEFIEGFWWLTEVSTSRQVMEITTMRQVHLLLAAAGVSE